MRSPSRSLLLALSGALLVMVVVVVAAVVLAVRSTDGPDPSVDEAAEAPVRTLEGLAQDPPPVRRADFCDQVAPPEVEAALGEPVVTAESYGDGDTAVLGEGVEDVAHEHGCRWISAAGVEARAWVFVPPVTPGRAERLVALAGRGEGCTAAPGASYGEPGVVTTCTDPASGALTVAHQGLFGDAWLTCTLSTPAGAAPAGATGADGVTGVTGVTDRAEAWCVRVAVAGGRSA